MKLILLFLRYYIYIRNNTINKVKRCIIMLMANENQTHIGRSLALRATNVRSVEGEVSNVGSVEFTNKDQGGCGSVTK